MTDELTDMAGPVAAIDEEIHQRVFLGNALKSVKLGEVRNAFSADCYRRSTGRALGALAFDVALYGAALGGVFAFGHPLVRLGCGVLAGLAVSFMFVWAHDAAHGALFANGVVSEVLGTAAMLPSLQMYRLWCYGHNKVHHGFTSFSPIDWIWRPLTAAEYQSRSRWRRFVYRLERHPATCGLHYLLRVWWSGMVRFRPAQTARRAGYRWSKLGTFAFAGMFAAAAHRRCSSHRRRCLSHSRPANGRARRGKSPARQGIPNPNVPQPRARRRRKRDLRPSRRGPLTTTMVP